MGETRLGADLIVLKLVILAKDFPQNVIKEYLLLAFRAKRRSLAKQ